MTPDTAALVSAARSLMAWSDTRAAELAARTEAARAAYAAGETAGLELGRALALGELAVGKREVSALVAEAIKQGDARLEAARWRWHVCCRRCRRLGHQSGCENCHDGPRAAFADNHPDDYPGATPRPLMEARGAA